MNGDYVHSSEGIDDMPAHIKSTLTNSNLTLSVLEGVVQLGIWQGIYLFEHREINKNRTILVHIFETKIFNLNFCFSQKVYQVFLHMSYNLKIHKVHF